MINVLKDVMDVSRRASRWEEREGTDNNTQAILVEYNGMFESRPIRASPTKTAPAAKLKAKNNSSAK